jgi:hypothetical protein
MKENDKYFPKQQPEAAGSLLKQSCNDLISTILESPVPNETIKSVPAQTLYIALKVSDAESAAQLIQAATPEQYQVFLDFEYWHKDHFVEENFWAWLKLIDEADNLERLTQFCANFDRKLLALVLQRNVEVVSLDDPTLTPPLPNCYTPDKGYTWISFRTTDPERVHLLGKLLALIFELDVDLFYQFLVLPISTNIAQLEEEAYEDQWRRLADHGVPQHETAFAINTPLKSNQAASQLQEGIRHQVVEYPYIAYPLVQTSLGNKRLDNLFSQAVAAQEPKARECFQSELTLIANAGIVYYGVPFYEAKEVELLIVKIRGAISIGLELANQLCSLSLLDIYHRLGLQKLYRLGLGSLHELRKSAMTIPEQALSAAADDQPAFAVVSLVRELFPCVPRFFQEDGSFRQIEEGKLDVQPRAFESLAEVNAAAQFIRTRFGV